MRALILAAGYATRLYPLTLSRAKPLLPVAGRPLVNHIVERLQAVTGLQEILLVTNARFAGQFRAWQTTVRSRCPVTVVDDGTASNQTRLGAIGDIAHVLHHRPDAWDDLLVIAGDNLFSWPLAPFVARAHRRRPAATLGVYHVSELALLRRYGTVQLAADGRVTAFAEKSPRPLSTLAASGIYYFPTAVLALLRAYVSSGGRPDMPGHFLEWLVRRHTVVGHTFHGSWYDIGNLSSYQQACRTFAGRSTQGA